MNRRMTAAGLAMALLLGMVMTVLVGGPATARAEMSKERAGRYYLASACPANAVADTFYRKIWKGRQTISKSEVRRRLPELKKLSRGFAVSEARFARRLLNPPAKWPLEVRPIVKRLANKSIIFATRRWKQGNVRTAGRWLYWNGQANEVNFGRLSVRIRAKLDLPAGC
ncbi:MAG: hypothetical protein Q7J48_14700 [Nocardioides sp.]|nr:hypothetical protein [Nocardioides sp.]